MLINYIKTKTCHFLLWGLKIIFSIFIRTKILFNPLLYTLKKIEFIISVFCVKLLLSFIIEVYSILTLYIRIQISNINYDY